MVTTVCKCAVVCKSKFDTQSEQQSDNYIMRKKTGKTGIKKLRKCKN